MDSKLVNAKAQEFASRSVRLTPALIAQLGLEKKSVQLRLDEFFLSCIPFDLSLTKASLLSFLSEAEVAFFSKMRDKAQKLSLTFALPYTSKPATFFILCSIKAFRKPAPNSPYCFVDVEFREAPLVLKEILVGYFLESDEAERFYQGSTDTALTAEQCLSIFDSGRLSILAEDSSRDRLKVCYLSPKRLRLFGEIEGQLPAIGAAIEFEPYEGDSSCLVRGIVRGITPLVEAAGFAFLDVELDYCPRLHAKMRKAVMSAGQAASVPQAKP